MLKELEDWWNGKDILNDNSTENIFKAKGRWVQITIDTKFGATCWEVILGNTEISLNSNWYKPEEIDLFGSCVIANEVPFIISEDGQFPENVVFAAESTSQDGWPGLEKTIKVALDKAKELGL